MTPEERMVEDIIKREAQLNHRSAVLLWVQRTLGTFRSPTEYLEQLVRDQENDPLAVRRQKMQQCAEKYRKGNPHALEDYKREERELAFVKSLVLEHNYQAEEVCQLRTSLASALQVVELVEITLRKHLPNGPVEMPRPPKPEPLMMWSRERGPAEKLSYHLAAVAEQLIMACVKAGAVFVLERRLQRVVPVTLLFPETLDNLTLLSIQAVIVTYQYNQLVAKIIKARPDLKLGKWSLQPIEIGELDRLAAQAAAQSEEQLFAFAKSDALFSTYDDHGAKRRLRAFMDGKSTKK